MGVVTAKPMVMFRPTELEVATALPPAQTAGYMPATVVDRIDMYFIVKYFLRFEDGLVRFSPALRQSCRTERGFAAIHVMG